MASGAIEASALHESTSDLSTDNGATGVLSVHVPGPVAVASETGFASATVRHPNMEETIVLARRSSMKAVPLKIVHLELLISGIFRKKIPKITKRIHFRIIGT